MTETTADLADAVQLLAAAVLTSTDDPAEQARLLAALAGYAPAAQAGGGVVGASILAVRGATAALCRRAALAALARASTAAAPPTYDDGAALRDLVCGLLAAEELVAADAAESDVAAALRALRLAVYADLSARVADLPRLRTITSNAALPALVQANRLYGDAGRADDLVAQAEPVNPLFMPREYRAPSS